MGPLELTVGEQMTVSPKLELGTLSEVVEVQSAAPPVTTSNSSVSQLVDTKRIEQLPLNGRNALQLVALLPGVVNAGNAGQFGATQVTFSTSGGRNIDMNFTLDGGYNMNSFYSIANEYPNPDALQEFSTTTRNYTAAFGRGTSSVAAVTRSGTNQFHGSAFEFLRNTELDARSFFSAKRADFKRNQYGGTFGGPIVKNRLFFFLGYQGTKVRGTPGDVRYRTLNAASGPAISPAVRRRCETPITETRRFPEIRFLRTESGLSQPSICRSICQRQTAAPTSIPSLLRVTGWIRTSGSAAWIT